jgi:probable rRNA maturation factor
MSLELTIRNRQRTRGVNLRLLRRILIELLREMLESTSIELGITLVAAPEMARINWQFLQHEGATDVITFDHTEKQTSRRKLPAGGGEICGELFICVDEAVRQARSFRTTWQAEVVRYLVHGVLHLCGHDDRQFRARRRMKREEDRLVNSLGEKLSFHQLARPARKQSGS